MTVGRLLIISLVAISCIVILCAAFSVDVWPLEPLAAFVSQASLALVIIAAFALRYRRYGAGASLLVFSLFFGLPALLPTVLPEPPVNKQPCCIEVNIGHANLFSHGLGIKTVKKWAYSQNIEILELTELPDPDKFDLAKEFPEFPFVLKGAQYGRRKVVILSKFPLELIHTDNKALLTAIAQIDEYISLTIVSTHPTIPMSPKHMAIRDTAIQQAFEEAAKRQPAIVLGDFNAVPWTPSLASSSRELDFKRSSRGAYQSTWITPFPFVGLPIDHIYASYTVDIRQSGTGPFIFSDHWPIFATVAIPVN